MQDLGSLGPGSAAAYGLSRDGSTVTGTSNGRAFRWTADQGMQSLGSLSGTWSEGLAANDDGSAITGFTETGELLRQHAFRWTSGGGMQDLGSLGGAESESWGNAINGDGSVVVGLSYANDSGDHAFRWTSSGGMQDLGTLGGAAEAFAVSNDGAVVAGSSSTADIPAEEHAFRWTSSGGMQDLGTLGGYFAQAYAVSGDGSAICGYSFVDRSSRRHAFLWTSALGMVDLNTYLPTLGIDLTGWDLTAAKGISSDGSAITGYGTINGQTRAFLVTGIPAPSSFSLIAALGLMAVRRRR